MQCVLAVLVAARGSFDEARGLLDRAQRTYDELGLSLKRAASMYVAYVDVLAGDAPAAEHELRRSYEDLQRMGEKSQFSTTAALLAHTLCDQGRLAEADGYTIASEQAASRDDVASQVLWRTSRARVLADRGEAVRAESLARTAVARAEQTDCLELRGDALVHLAEVLGKANRTDEAVEALQRAILLYDEKGTAISAARARARLEQLPSPA